MAGRRGGGVISGRVRALNLTVPLGSGQTISGTGRVRASVLSPCRPLSWTAGLVCFWRSDLSVSPPLARIMSLVCCFKPLFGLCSDSNERKQFSQPVLHVLFKCFQLLVLMKSLWWAVFVSVFSRSRSWGRSAVDPSRCLRSRSPVCWPTLSSAPFLEETLSGRSTATIPTSTSAGVHQRRLTTSALTYDLYFNYILSVIQRTIRLFIMHLVYFHQLLWAKKPTSWLKITQLPNNE